VPVHKKNNDNGQSLYEVVFSLAIAALIVGAIVSLGAVSVRNSAFSRNKTLANRYLQGTTEWLRQKRDTDWTSFNALATGGTYCLSQLTTDLSGMVSGVCGSGDFILGTDIFYRQVTLANAGVDTIRADVLITWADSNGMHDVNTATLYTRWRDEF